MTEQAQRIVQRSYDNLRSCCWGYHLVLDKLKARNDNFWKFLNNEMVHWCTTDNMLHVTKYAAVLAWWDMVGLSSWCCDVVPYLLISPTSAGAACAGMGMRQGVHEQQPPHLPRKGLWGSEHHHAGGQHMAWRKPCGFVREGSGWPWSYHLDKPSSLWDSHRSKNRMGAELCKQHIAEVSSQWNGGNHSCKQSCAAEHWDSGLKIPMLHVRKLFEQF